jgi:hypothetical protein
VSIYANPASSIVSGNTVVTTAGTRVPLSTTQAVIAWVIITAAPANTGKITVGGVDVVATADAELGVTLSAGDSITLPVNNLNSVYLDSTVSGDEVGYLYGKVAA